MADTNPWAEQWLNAQKQFVESWSTLATPGSAASDSSQPDHSQLWAEGFKAWQNAFNPGASQSNADLQNIMSRCFDMGKGYMSMADQLSQFMAQGSDSQTAMQQWLDQLNKSLEPLLSASSATSMPEMPDFFKTWFSPSNSWQQMISGMFPEGLLPGLDQLGSFDASQMNPSSMMDFFSKSLSTPGLGYFRESQEKQQKAFKLLMEYQQADFQFNQAFAKVTSDSIQQLQQSLLSGESEALPTSMRALYDLWVDISEEHYADFAMTKEYQSLYGDMVNKLMAFRQHQQELTDDALRKFNLPTRQEIDTVQSRLQQTRRENRELRQQLKSLESKVDQLISASKTPSEQAKSPAAKKTAIKKKASVKKAATRTKAKTGSKS